MARRSLLPTSILLCPRIEPLWSSQVVADTIPENDVVLRRESALWCAPCLLRDRGTLGFLKGCAAFAEF